jgi:hypothetical protein
MRTKRFLSVLLLLVLFGAVTQPVYASEDHKVSVCHNVLHNPHTIVVDFHAVPAHLDHGDSVGACNVDPDV